MESTLQQSIERLNPPQKEAVTTLHGPILVIAGAGSGKTSVLTTRIANLIENGVPPQRILALTFTKKAAEEMRTRITNMTGDRARLITMGTFHSVFIRFLRPFADRIFFPGNFTILDEDDSTACLKRIIEGILMEGWPPKENWSKEMKEEYKKRMSAYPVRQVKETISSCKNHLITADAYLADARLQRKAAAAKQPLLGRIYQEYRNTCHRMCMMDYDDILLYTDILLANHPDVLGMIAGSYDHILVDEYQDTNTAQYSILRRLTWINKNLCVVGDDSQSIYAFRGACIDNIFSFKEDYPGCKVVKLENNYRSTKNIVNAANNLISHNEDRIPKVCFSDRDKGYPITIKTTYNEKGEAAYIAETILQKKRETGRRFKDFAVLFRTNAQSRAIEDALVKKRIPYVVYSGTAFFERMEVKDMMAYYKLAVNPNDEESLRRVINKPVRGLGDQAVKKLSEIAGSWGLSIWDAINHPQFELLGLPARMMGGVYAFRDTIRQAIGAAAREDSFTAAQSIAGLSGLLKHYESQKDDDSAERLSNIQELINAAKTFQEEVSGDDASSDDDLPTEDTLAAFLQDAALLSNADSRAAGDDDCVSIMTVHSAKGLEFDTVFIAGAENNLFPLSIDKTAFELEEERRLFYVAMTRAMNELFITKTEKRMKYGRYSDSEPSPFLKEIRKSL